MKPVLSVKNNVSFESSIALDELEFIINEKFKQGYKHFSVFQGHGPGFHKDSYNYADSVGGERQHPVHYTLAADKTISPPKS